MPQNVLIDTNVISYLFKKDSRGDTYLKEYLMGNIWVMSFMTLAELDSWAMRYDWPEIKKASLKRFLNRFILLPFDRKLCNHWAQVTDITRRKGFTISCADAWIAASALYYKIPLITHNRKDFIGIDDIEIFSI